MPTLNIVFDAAPLPEGWIGTPSEFVQMIASLLTAESEGDFPAGQLGGSTPTEDVGVWFNLDNLETEFWNGTKYVPAVGIPVGVIMDWPAAANTTLPANFIEAQGQLLQRSSYPELYDAYRETWGTPPNADTFYVPTAEGRICVGAGTGKYVPDGSGLSGPGSMAPVTTGQYFGSESIQVLDKPVNGPSSLRVILSPNQNVVAAGKKIAAVIQPSLGVRKIIRYR